MRAGDNFAIITLDALRYDVAMTARTPNLAQLAAVHGYNAKTWQAVWAQGTFTLPAHVAMFQGGFFPACADNSLPPPYSRQQEVLFRYSFSTARKVHVLLPETATSVCDGFKKLGYTTYGVGGVGWFDTRRASASIWPHFFDVFTWQEAFQEQRPDAFEAQIALCRTLQLAKKTPVLFFLNVPSTHWPYRGLGRTFDAQVQCLEYVDKHFEVLLAQLPRPLCLLICGDHGDCFGEDGLFGHGFYHPKVLEVPMLYCELR